MDPNRLQALLTELHRELAGAESLDAESRQMLERVLDDVRRLGSPGEAAEPPTGQLQEAALRLEAEHPRLAAALGQLGDALAKLGI
jgi:hypothetical protein